MIKKRVRWLLACSVVVACLQYAIFFGSRRAFGYVYGPMVLSLDLFNQSVVPTLRPSTEGWPLPTPFGFVLYALLSALVAFLILSIVTFIIGWLVGLARYPNQSSKRTR